MFATFLRSLRELRGLTQQQLAEIARVSQPNISAIENGRRAPSADVVNRLVVACGFRLMAVAGEQRIPVPLPKVGWFPDDDLPAWVPGDPADEAPVITADAPDDVRNELLMAVLELGEATAGR